MSTDLAQWSPVDTLQGYPEAFAWQLLQTEPETSARLDAHNAYVLATGVAAAEFGDTTAETLNAAYAQRLWEAGNRLGRTILIAEKRWNFARWKEEIELLRDSLETPMELTQNWSEWFNGLLLGTVQINDPRRYRRWPRVFVDCAVESPQESAYASRGYRTGAIALAQTTEEPHR